MITLPVFHHTDQTADLKDLDIDYDLEDCEIRNVTFFNINAISVYSENDVDYAEIHCNGTSFICALTYEAVIATIKANEKA